MRIVTMRMIVIFDKFVVVSRKSSTIIPWVNLSDALGYKPVLTHNAKIDSNI